MAYYRNYLSIGRRYIGNALLLSCRVVWVTLPVGQRHKCCKRLCVCLFVHKYSRLLLAAILTHLTLGLLTPAGNLFDFDSICSSDSTNWVTNNLPRI